MPSPFPGMNPFLEQEDVWKDFHERFIPAAAEEIGRQVQPAYVVRIDQNVYVHEAPDADRVLLGRPDIYLAQSSRDTLRTPSATLDPPVRARLVPLQITERESFLEIRDGASRKLVTAIELLSPSNKTPGSDRDQYLAKRNRYLTTGVHLVEIDLLRGGRRIPLDPPTECDYCVLVSRAEDRPEIALWPLALRDPLPVIPIPLHPRDGHAQLDLQSLLHRIFDAAGYRYNIYDGEPNPPLTLEDRQWADRTVELAK